MNKQIAHVPLEQISRLEIVVTKCRKSLTEVKGETGADYILNGGMWNPDGSPCVGLKVGGRLLSRTPWGTVHGYGWTGTDIHMTLDWRGCANYLAVSPINSSLDYIGIYFALIYVSGDGSFSL